MKKEQDMLNGNAMKSIIIFSYNLFFCVYNARTRFP